MSKQIHLLQINYSLYFSLHKILRKVYSIDDEEDHHLFFAQYVSPLFDAYNLVDGFLREYDGDSDFINVDYSCPIDTQLSDEILGNFPSYNKYIANGGEEDRLPFVKKLQPISELQMELKRKRYNRDK